MTLVKDRHIGRYSHYDGGVIEPSPKASVESLPDGQVQPVTDWVGIHLGVREGGSLVPPVDVGVRNSTQERIVMYVDFATGSSPAEGTKVVNQAEYDALSGDLKYLDDAFAILPDNIAWPVEIHLRDGVQHPNPDNIYYTPALDGEQLVLVPGRLRHFDARIDFTDTSFYYPAIYIIGDNKTTLDSEQSGTIAEDMITRDAGTWTADEYQGKLVMITTGAGAGKIAPIYTHDTTTLRIPDLGVSGSCSFEIYEPASSIEYNDPVNGFIGLGSDESNASVMVQFHNVTIGSPSAPSAITTGSVNYYFVESILHTQRMHLEGVINVGRLNLQNSCLVIDDSSGSGLRLSHYLIDIRESAIIGVGSFSFPVCTISYLDFWLLDTVIYLASDSDVPLISCEETGAIDWSGNNKLVGPGTGNATGISVTGILTIEGSSAIQDCGAGIEAKGIIEWIGTVSPDSSGNANGIAVSEGGKLVVGSPSNLGGSSSEITIDSEAFSYSDISSGDSLTGQSGSQIVSR